MISSCGKSFAICSTDGGTKADLLAAASFPPLVSKPDFIRHSGQKPWGAPETTGFPQTGQSWVVTIILPPVCKGKWPEGYSGNNQFILSGTLATLNPVGQQQELFME